MKKLTDEQKQELKRKLKIVGGSVLAYNALKLAYRLGGISGINEVLNTIVKNDGLELGTLDGEVYMFTAKKVVKEVIK